MTNSMPSAAYRRLVGLSDPDAQQEMSSEEYRRLVDRQSANGLLRNLDSSKVDTETPAKTEFGEWLVAVSPYPVVPEFQFLPDRRFRADWAVVELKCLFEYDGVVHHTGMAGAWRDACKSNLAQLAGWLFIRVNAASLRDGTGYVMAERAISLRSAS